MDESIWGFLVGASITGSFAYAFLLDSQKGSNAALVSSMGHVQAAVESVKKSLSKFESLEEGLGQLRLDAATKVDLERQRSELLKEIVIIFPVLLHGVSASTSMDGLNLMLALQDEVHVAHLELKKHVSNLESKIKISQE